MLVLNVVKYSVIGLSLFFGTVNAMDIEGSKNFDIPTIVSSAESRNDARLNELLTTAASDDVLLKQIVDYLGSEKSNSREAHRVSSCMHYLREDAYVKFGASSDTGTHYKKVNKLFGSIASCRNLCSNPELNLSYEWGMYIGTITPPVCHFETNQQYGWW